MENQKRRIPKVEPVSREGVRYEVVRGAKSRDFGQNGGVIAAVEEKTPGRELWTLVVYKVDFDPKEEADVQDVYITKLSLSKDGTGLLVETEKEQRFAVNLADRKVEKLEKPGKEGRKEKPPSKR